MNVAAILKLKGLEGRNDQLGHVAARHYQAASHAWHRLHRHYLLR